MATVHLNQLGFLYFLLFLVHTLAYYSFRGKPFLNTAFFAKFLLFATVLVTETAFDYLLETPRFGHIDIRQFFCYCNIIVSTIALLVIMVLKIALHMSG